MRPSGCPRSAELPWSAKPAPASLQRLRPCPGVWAWLRAWLKGRHLPGKRRHTCDDTSQNVGTTWREAWSFSPHLCRGQGACCGHPLNDLRGGPGAVPVLWMGNDLLGPGLAESRPRLRQVPGGWVLSPAPSTLKHPGVLLGRERCRHLPFLLFQSKTSCGKN